MNDKKITALHDDALEKVAGGAFGRDDTRYQVVLKERGPSAMSVIETLKAFLGLSLREAKELVDSIPVTICTNAEKEEAYEIKAALEKCGAEVTITVNC